MKKKARVYIYAEDAVHIVSHLNDFVGNVQEWKNAVYELFRYDMTWSFAHKIDVIESRSSGVFVSIIAKPAYEKSILGTMEDLGFRNTVARHDDIGWIECTDLPEEMLFDYVYVAY